MLFKFVGRYTGANETINVGGKPEDGGVDFKGHEPAEVTKKELIDRLTNNPEFEMVGKPEKKAKKEPKNEDDKEVVKGLRAEYEAKFGKKPFSGWDADTLIAKLAA